MDRSKKDGIFLHLYKRKPLKCNRYEVSHKPIDNKQNWQNELCYFANLIKYLFSELNENNQSSEHVYLGENLFTKSIRQELPSVNINRAGFEG